MTCSLNAPTAKIRLRPKHIDPLHCLQSISEQNQRAKRPYGLAANGYPEPDVETKLSRLVVTEHAKLMLQHETE